MNRRRKSATSTQHEHQGIIAAALAYSAAVHTGSPVRSALEVAQRTAITWGLHPAMARYITRDIADVVHVVPLPERDAHPRPPSAAVPS